MLMIIGCLINLKDKESLRELFTFAGDGVLIFLLFTLLGRKFPSVHNYSIVALCLTRTFVCVLQVQLVYFEVGSLDDESVRYDYSGTIIGYTIIPASMLFLTSYRTYLYILFPVMCIAQTVVSL